MDKGNVFQLLALWRSNQIIADEPTTALDVTTQSEILSIFNDLNFNMNIGIILISHNIGVIAETADRVAVMKNGLIVENGSTFNVLTNPKDEYTKHLLSCIPPVRQCY